MNDASEIEVELHSKSGFTIEMKCDELSLCLFSDYFFESNRAKEQIKTIENLLTSNSQIAWTLVSTYYACFYMANVISKLCGNFIVNFSHSEFSTLLSKAEISSISMSIEDNNSFAVSYSNSDYDGRVKLVFRRVASKPHKEVWRSLNSIIRNLEVSDNHQHVKCLLQNITSSDNLSWKLPSTIRNEWNYTYANYYSDKGEELATKFKQILPRSSSSEKWANNRHLAPHEQNIVATIAFVYHTLKLSIEQLEQRLFPS